MDEAVKFGGRLTREQIRLLERWATNMLGAAPTGAEVWQVRLTDATRPDGPITLTSETRTVNPQAIETLLSSAVIQQASRIVVSWHGPRDERGRRATVAEYKSRSKAIYVLLAEIAEQRGETMAPRGAAPPPPPPPAGGAALPPDHPIAIMMMEVDKVEQRGENLSPSMVRFMLTSIMAFIHYSEVAQAARFAAVESLSARAFSLTEVFATDLRALATNVSSPAMMGALWQAGITQGEYAQFRADLPLMNKPVMSERAILLDKALDKLGMPLLGLVMKHGGAGPQKQITTEQQSKEDADNGAQLLKVIRDTTVAPSAVANFLLLAVPESFHSRLRDICQAVVTGDKVS